MSSTAPRFPSPLLLGPCTLFSLILTATALGQAETPTGDAGPDDLSKGDWSSIRAAYEAGRHAVHPVEGGHQARNPGQGWLTRFDGRGFLTEPDSGAWTWGLELERYGLAGSEQELTSPARVSVEGGRVAYVWDANLEEWYVNDTRGLEHGYTVHSRPARVGQNAESPLTFTLAVRGELHPEVVDAGRGVRFLDAGGAVVLTYTGLTVFDADGQELEAGFEAIDDEGARLLLTVDERSARYPLVIDPIAQHAYLKASNTGWLDSFGSSVAVSGDTVVVGASLEDSNSPGVNGNQSNNFALDAGAAYVFVYSGTSWSQEAYLKASNPGPQDLFGRSVAVSGDTIVVGAYQEDSSTTGVNGYQYSAGAPESGAAYVFVRSGTTWSQEAYIKASNPGPGDQFAFSVAVSGDTVVVGAAGEDSSASGVNGNQSDESASWAGAAYVFVRSGTSWSQEAYLKASNTDALDGFGQSVAVSEETVLVGANLEDSVASGVNGNQNDNSRHNSGAAYVFVRSGTSWSQEAYLKASNTGGGDQFGYFVALSDDTAVVGAPNEDSDATGVNANLANHDADDSGAAYVFLRSGASWSQEASLKASNTETGDHFGLSVAVSGDTIVIATPVEDSDASGVNGNQSSNSAPHSGAGYVFARSGMSWSQSAYLKASNSEAYDRFGRSVAVSGATIVIGADAEDSNASGVNGNQSNNNREAAGAAYVFDLGLGAAYCTAGPNSTGAPAVISASGSASVAANDLLLRADFVPTQPGVFFYGSQQTGVPFGNGTLCIAGQIGRLDVVNAAGNVMTFLLDNTSPPSAVTQITAGSSWNFQAWFRDPAAGGAFFNLSDGLSVTFGP